MYRLFILVIIIPGIIIFSSCQQNTSESAGITIDVQNIDRLVLIQVDHPYVGKGIDSFMLDQKYWAAFLSDFADKKEEPAKFYSCYVIKIYYKNRQFLSYRTNGKLFEVLKDDHVKSKYFKLNQDLNLVSKYWEYRKTDFAIRPIEVNKGPAIDLPERKATPMESGSKKDGAHAK